MRHLTGNVAALNRMKKKARGEYETCSTFLLFALLHEGAGVESFG